MISTGRGGREGAGKVEGVTQHTGVGVSALRGEVSSRGITYFVPASLGLQIYGRHSGPAMGPFIVHGCRWLHESQPPPDHGVHLELGFPHRGDQYRPESHGLRPRFIGNVDIYIYTQGFMIGGCDPSTGAAEPTATLWLSHEGKISPRARHGLPPTGPRAGESPPATNCIPEQ